MGTNPLARIANGPKMTDAKYIIISQYMSEIQPHMDKMKEVLMLSKHQFIIDESGIRKVSYNDETKYKINMLNKKIKLIADNYRSQYPELFKFI